MLQRTSRHRCCDEFYRCIENNNFLCVFPEIGSFFRWAKCLLYSVRLSGFSMYDRRWYVCVSSDACWLNYVIWDGWQMIYTKIEMIASEYFEWIRIKKKKIISFAFMRNRQLVFVISFCCLKIRKKELRTKSVNEMKMRHGKITRKRMEIGWDLDARMLVHQNLPIFHVSTTAVAHRSSAFPLLNCTIYTFMIYSFLLLLLLPSVVTTQSFERELKIVRFMAL